MYSDNKNLSRTHVIINIDGILAFKHLNISPILFFNSIHKRFHVGRDDMIKTLTKHNIYNQVKTIYHSPHTFWLFKFWFKKTLEYIIKFLGTVFQKENS